MSTPLRIAIADDEADVRNYFVKALRRGGHEVVVEAADGRELVERCRVERPDLLITDIRMDHMTGIEAMYELARDGPIPTILISAHYRPEDVDGLNEGVIAFLSKPVKLAELMATVNEAAHKLV
jgi:response regulator NasT